MAGAQREIDRDRKEPVIENQHPDVMSEDEQFAPLFLPDVAKDLRSRWDDVQRSFVDDPRQAIREGGRTCCPGHEEFSGNMFS